MKKKFITVLVIATVILGNIHGVKAASSDTKIKITLENIKEIMINNSLKMESYKLDLDAKKDAYEDAKDRVDDAEDELKDAEDAESNYSPAEDGSDASEEASLENNVDKAKSTLESAENKEDSAKTAYETAKINYKQNVENAVYQAQQDYINYLTTLSSKDLAQKNLGAKEKAERVAKLKYDSGFLAKKDYIATMEDNTDYENKLKEAEDAEALARTKLCSELGIKNNENIIFNDDIKEDLQRISQINYNNDLSEMLDNNYAIKLDKKSINQAEDTDKANEDNDDEYDDDDANYTIKSKKIALKQEIKTAEENFKKQYNTLMNSYNSIIASYDKLGEKERLQDVTQIKLDYGFISQTEADNSKLTLDTDTSTFETNKRNFYLNYLHYIQMKEGY